MVLRKWGQRGIRKSSFLGRLYVTATEADDQIMIRPSDRIALYRGQTAVTKFTSILCTMLHHF